MSLITMPVLADKTFATLSVRQSTRDAIERMKITNPTQIQADALPLLLDGRDVIGQSRTGSGKTLAFGIPAVEIVDPSLRAVQVLVLTPTRELAVQVGDVIAALSQGTGIRTVLVYGGRAMGPQKDALRRGAQIVVGTPGRVADLHGQGDLRLNNVRFLVLDEADEMLDRGFRPQVEQILGWTPRDRQTALFSATIPEWVDQASKKHLRNPEHIAVSAAGLETETIEHVAYDVPSGGKLDALKDLMDARGDGQMIVFGRTKHGVKKLAKQLVAAGYPVAALQGNLSQNARDQVMADFRAGKVQILLATNVAARGIDVTAVDHVINYELPESAELLQHRIGRTGRMGRSGSAITLLSDDDAAKWRQLERGAAKRIQRKPWTGARRVDSTPKIVSHAASTPANGRPSAVDHASANGRTSVASHGNATPRPERQSRQERAPRPDRSAPQSPPAARSERPVRRERTHVPRPPAGSQPIMPDLTSIGVVSQLIAEQRGYVPQPVAPTVDPALFEDDDQAEVQPNVNATRRPNWASGPRTSMADRIDREHPEGRASRDHRPSSPSPRRKRGGERPANGSTQTMAGENRKPRTETRSPKEQHTAACSSCGRTATLSFAPDLSRPVYCDACFKSRSETRRPTRRTSA